MKRRFLAVWSLLLVLSMVLAACPGQPAPTEAPAVQEVAPTEAPAAQEAAPTEAPAAQEAAPAEGVITLNFISGGPGAGLDFTMKQVEEWNAANPDIQVNVIPGPTSATDRYGLYLQTFQAQSSDIDVLEIDVIWPGDLAEHLIDFYEYEGVTELVADDFPAIVQNNTVDGRLVGLPFFTDAGLLYYRTDLLEKYGFDGPPQTWDELEQMAQTIQDGERAEGNQDFWGFVWQGQAYEGLTCDALEWIYSHGGGTIVSPDKVITINNDAAAAALDRAYSWIGKITPPGVTSFMEEESRRVWHGGNAAFMRNWPYAYSLSAGEDSAVAGKFDATNLPGAEPGMSAATLGGWQLAVSKYSKHPEAAVKFAMWLAGTESQKARAAAVSLIPTKSNLYSDQELISQWEFLPRMLPVLENAVARPSTATAPRYNEVSNIFFSNVSSVLTGQQSGADAVANIELDLQDLLGFEVGAP